MVYSPANALLKQMKQAPCGVLLKQMKQAPCGVLLKQIKQVPCGVLLKQMKQAPCGVLLKQMKQVPCGVLFKHHAVQWFREKVRVRPGTLMLWLATKKPPIATQSGHWLPQPMYCLE